MIQGGVLIKQPILVQIAMKCLKVMHGIIVQRIVRYRHEKRDTITT